LRPAGIIFNGFGDRHEDLADNLPTKRPMRATSRPTPPQTASVAAAADQEAAVNEPEPAAEEKAA